jgi:multiple sugar transport system permease protein
MEKRLDQSDISTHSPMPRDKSGRHFFSLETKEKALGFALISPSVLFFLVLIVYPILQTIVYSLFVTNTLTMQSRFIGLGNYSEILTSSEFLSSFTTTLIWTCCVLTLQLILGVSMALILHGTLLWRSTARALVLFPYLLPTTVAVLVWQWLFNDLYGIVNYSMVSVGIIDKPISWLGRMPNALISVIIVGTWKLFPFVVIAVLARLQAIPEVLYEAAKIDGASTWHQFWDITMPQLRSVLVIVILLRSIWDFKEFDLIYLMTGGGPSIGTQTLPLLVYKEAFPLLHYGKAAAVAVSMLMLMLLFFFLYLRSYGKQEEEAE